MTENKTNKCFKEIKELNKNISKTICEFESKLICFREFSKFRI